MGLRRPVSTEESTFSFPIKLRSIQVLIHMVFVGVTAVGGSRKGGGQDQEERLHVLDRHKPTSIHIYSCIFVCNVYWWMACGIAYLCLKKTKTHIPTSYTHIFVHICMWCVLMYVMCKYVPVYSTDQTATVGFLVWWEVESLCVFVCCTSCIVCCSVLQCVVVCCSMLQHNVSRVAARMQPPVLCVAVCVAVCAAAWCNVLQCVAVSCVVTRWRSGGSVVIYQVELVCVLQCVLLFVAVCCSVICSGKLEEWRECGNISGWTRCSASRVHVCTCAHVHICTCTCARAQVGIRMCIRCLHVLSSVCRSECKRIYVCMYVHVLCVCVRVGVCTRACQRLTDVIANGGREGVGGWEAQQQGEGAVIFLYTCMLWSNTTSFCYKCAVWACIVCQRK